MTGEPDVLDAGGPRPLPEPDRVAEAHVDCHRHDEAAACWVELRASMTSDTWRSIEATAGRHGVAVSELLHEVLAHATGPGGSDLPGYRTGVKVAYEQPAKEGRR